ncbi:MAG: N-acetylmuramoyl-L-alanine amidase [Chitinophagia bacterium]
MKQNRLILAITYSLVALFTLISLSTEAQSAGKTIKRIIIDPGHGGTDPGSNGKYSTEAAVSLAISMKLEEYIKESIPDVEVMLTRRTDIYNSVVEKANIANAAKGDLFICIHTNSADPRREREIIGYTNKTYTVKKKGVKRKVTRRVPLYKNTYTPSTARGTETFIYNVGKSDQKKDMANEAVEDVVEKLDSVSINQIKAIEEADPTRSMMVSLLTQQFFQRAASLALTIEEEFKAAGRISREAKQRQKGIWVLAAVQMPAVLVETGFISNPEDEDYLNSDEGQNQICEVITKSILRYKNSLENQKKTNAN